jgi:hypothetical protein
MNFYEFAGNHPFLTFFLFSIVGNCVVRTVRSFNKNYKFCKRCKNGRLE